MQNKEPAPTLVNADWGEVEISWKVPNAETVTFNDEIVDDTGNIKVIIYEST